MLEKGKINGFQFICLVTLYVIGDAILIMPSVLAAEAKQDAWIVALLSIGIGYIFIFLFTALASRYPNMTFVEYSDKILGKWIGKISSLLLISFLFLLLSLMLREMGDFMLTQIMPETPIQFIHIFFLLIIIMGARLGIETIARTSEILFPWVFILFCFFSFFLAPEMEFKNIQPILEEGIKPILRASYTYIAIPFMESVVFLMILPYVNSKVKIRKSFLIGTTVGGIVILITVILTITVLGADTTARSTYPSYILAKKISVGELITRVEAILAIIWIITMFFKISLLFYSSTLGLAQIFKLKDYKSLLLPLGMISVVLSLASASNLIYFNLVVKDYYPLYDLTIGMLLPLFLLIIGKIRRV